MLQALANRRTFLRPATTVRFLSRLLLVGVLAASAAACAVFAAWMAGTPATTAADLRSTPACCLTLQIKVGAASLREDGLKYMRRIKPGRLHEPLETILKEGRTAPSQPHPLLGRPAAEFTLANEKGRPVALHSLIAAGPVLLVFYPGYFRDQCVAPLFALEEDVAYFDELGATIVAVSNDPSLWTAEQFNRYGKFSFRVLSDPKRETAKVYGAAANDDRSPADSALHAMFVIDSDGVVRWVYRGADPFAHTDVLLRIIDGCKKTEPDGGESTTKSAN